MEKKKVKHFKEEIFNWYANNKRDFPWRNENDPYKFLMVEILLRKTQAQQVKKIYEDFFTKFPNILVLYDSNAEEVKNVIKPLGLTGRVQWIKKASETIVNEFNSQVPSEEKKLLQIKGVGKYTARAVLCFAFNKRKAIVDSNIARIYSRCFSLKGYKDIRRAKHIWNFAEKILPSRDFKRYNYGLIDYGAKICKAKSPNCQLCPLTLICNFQDKTK